MSARIEKRREWEARLGRWKSAGTSVRQFCLEERVNEQSFYSWRRRLGVVGQRHTKRQVSPGMSTARVSSNGASFVPLHVIGGGGDGMSVEIRLPSGAWLRVTSSVEESRLRTLLRVMREEAA